ncbi:UDP-N-acetylmuramoyl-tripeptide--D-alanyl-D-alanine ligase [Virgibacillus soli]|uniref:UDP-N-acetylmuramoyl-tripeptide--D-alanyl-D- alanine ligase n=1 Tax=Paracerasibacillus soli TaxID=480284 RepID=UPI0035E7DBC6
MLFSVNWLASIHPHYRGIREGNIAIDCVTTDSREQKDNALFIPIEGDKFDGHDYIEQAMENGAVATLWQKDKVIPDNLPETFLVFLVDDTIHALQTLAKAYRFEINPTVIAVTGSNGKTTTKDMIGHILLSQFRTHMTSGNLNNHIGLPLTILSMPRDTEMLVLEMGMNHFGEIALLSKIANPDYAIITNIGESHIEFLGSREGIAKAKLEIVEGLKQDGVLIIDGDETLLEQFSLNNNIIRCGFQLNLDLVINQVEITQRGTVFSLSTGKTYEIPLLGKHHAKNATYAVAVATKLGMDPELVHQSLQTLSITGMRFELLEGINGVAIINDAYNASPTSMIAAIEVVKKLEQYKEKVLVLGDMFELGSQSKYMHESVVDYIEAPITTVYTIGAYAKNITSKLMNEKPDINTKHFADRTKLTDDLKQLANRETVILFKASRGMQLETIINTIRELQ